MKSTKLKDLLTKYSISNSTDIKHQFFNVCYEELFHSIYTIALCNTKNNADEVTQAIFFKILNLDLNKLIIHSNYIDKYLFKLAKNYCHTYREREIMPNRKLPLDVVSNKDTVSTPNVDLIIDFERALEKLSKKEKKQ